MDHDLVVFSIDRLFDERLLKHVAANHYAVVVLLHVLLRILEEHIRLDDALLLDRRQRVIGLRFGVLLIIVRHAGKLVLKTRLATVALAARTWHSVVYRCLL